jgi:hypothetical protein
MMTVVAAIAPGIGAACTVLAPFDMGQMAVAELVLVGTVTGYETLNATPGAAMVTIQVEESLKGGLSGEVTLIWNSGMAQGPHESRASGRVLVGAMKPGRKKSDFVQDQRPDLPEIVQPYCGEVWMIKAKKASLAEARKVLE